MSHTLINCTCKNRLGFSLLSFTLIPQYFKRFNWSNWKQNSEIHSAFACSHCLHDFLIFSNRTAHAWSVVAGNICSVFFVRVGSQISPRRAKKDSNIPSPGTTRSVKFPTPGPRKTIKSPPHALPPPPRRLYIDRCISCNVFSPFFSLTQNKVNSKNWGETNFEVSKIQKDVWDVFFKIKKKDDGDWNLHNFTLHELHAFRKYTSTSLSHDLLSFGFAMDDIFLRVLDST